MTNPHSVDVIVVGAGPAGLTAAGDLARCGRSVAVLERSPESTHPAVRSPRWRGPSKCWMPAGWPMTFSRAHRAPGVSIFAGARIDLTHLRSAYQFVAVTPQTNVDRVLAEYAANQGADIRRGFEVLALEQDPDGVTVTSRAKDNDDPRHRQTWRAKYVLGADGAHSTVRDLVGAKFPGKTILSSVVLADVKLADGPTSGELTLGHT